MKDSTENSQITTPIQIMFFDTDTGGVVHNIAYLRFIETARTQLAFQLGMDWDFMKKTSIYPVIVRTEIDYHRPALMGDDLEVHASLGESSKARFWCHFKIIRPSDNTLLITSQQQLAFVEMPKGRPLRLPEGFPTPFTPRPNK